VRFSKVILPLTTAQTARAVELFTAGMVALTERERQLYREACRKWQECIQEACCAENADNTENPPATRTRPACHAARLPQNGSAGVEAIKKDQEI
jgi:hypothetical protein